MANSAMQVTSWHQTANGFYLIINTVLPGAAAYIFGSSPTAVLTISLIGITIAQLWHESIDYFRELNSAKFKVIYELEEELPAKIFFKEHQYFMTGLHKHPVTRTERWVPMPFGMAYVLGALLSLVTIFKVI